MNDWLAQILEQQQLGPNYALPGSCLDGLSCSDLTTQRVRHAWPVSKWLPTTLRVGPLGTDLSEPINSRAISLDDI